MEVVKLNKEQAKIVREFTEYAKELYEKYKYFAENIRLIKDLPQSYDELKGNLWLLAVELEGTAKLEVNEEDVLLDRSHECDKANFIDMMLYRLNEVARYAALIEPYITISVRYDMQELSFKMRHIVRSIL